ncbi:MAG: TylF/MycF/NovP-related O-methyltransferase [Patescibacteria group bacterium]
MKRIKDKVKRFLYRLIVRWFWENNAIITRTLVNMSRPLNFQTRISNFYSDYILLATFELCVDEIKRKKIDGDVAELGVYRGDFAEKINQAFPDRKLHLFDTFGGFIKEHVEHDVNKNLAQNIERNFKFAEVSPEDILLKMKYPEVCQLHVGKFNKDSVPDTNFSFVRIDVDLYEPILEGLKSFYPKLSKGGYIFVHDYNNDHWEGVKKAVDEFLTENKLSGIPIPDSHGTIIISKNYV